MNCNKVSHLLSAFMDGELLGYEHRLIHHHLQSCSDCRNEYEELLQMKRLLAAMRLREPGQRLAATISRRVSQAGTDAPTIQLGNWRLQAPDLPFRQAMVSPAVGFGVGLTFFGMLLWAHAAKTPGAPSANHQTFVFETADIARDEPPPRVDDLTNGLKREGATSTAAFEPRYLNDWPEFPLAGHRDGRVRRPILRTSLFR